MEESAKIANGTPCRTGKPAMGLSRPPPRAGAGRGLELPIDLGAAPKIELIEEAEGR